MLAPTFIKNTFLMFLAALSLRCSSKGAHNKLQIAAASSLANVFESVVKEFTKDTGIQVVLIFASSGSLAQQITEGAPYDLFASADNKYLDSFIANGAIAGGQKTTYATGQLGLWTKKNVAPTDLSELRSADYEHIAIANPEHAPYGAAARQALKKLGLWSDIKNKTVRASSVRQALQFTESGNAEAAFVALSLVTNASGSYLPIDKTLYTPLAQSIAVLATSKRQDQARAFIHFLQSEKGHAVLHRYGLLTSGAAQ